jgi:alanine racemase
MVDVSRLTNHGPKEGDEVLIFGFELPLRSHAEMAETISYEILTSIAPRLPRVFEYD